MNFKVFPTIALSIFILTSCAIGPSKEEIKQDQINNTNTIVNHFVNEIWEKPLNEVFRQSRVRETNYKGQKNKVKILTVAPVTHQSRPASYTRSVIECSPEFPNFKMRASVFNKLSYYYKKGQTINMNYGYQTGWKERVNSKHRFTSRKMDPSTLDCIKSIEFSSYNISGGLRYPRYFDVRSLTATQIKDQLLSKGVPLTYCYKLNKEDNVEGIYCNIDWHLPENHTTHSTRRNGQPITYEMIRDPNFIIETRNGFLTKFQVKTLNVGEDEKHLSLEKIYYERLKDTKYRNLAKGFNAIVLEQIDRFAANKARQERLDDIEGRKYLRERKARFDALEKSHSDDSSIVMDAVNQLKNNTNTILNQRQKNFNKTYNKSSSKRLTNNRPIPQTSYKTSTNRKTTGPVVSCLGGNNKPTGSLRLGQYCYTDAPNKGSKSCNTFLKRPLVWSQRHSHCFNLGKQNKQNLVFSSWNINSCLCGVNKYSSPRCKMTYTISCKTSTMGSGKGKSK